MDNVSTGSGLSAYRRARNQAWLEMLIGSQEKEERELEQMFREIRLENLTYA